MQFAVATCGTPAWSRSQVGQGSRVPGDRAAHRRVGDLPRAREVVAAPGEQERRRERPEPRHVGGEHQPAGTLRRGARDHHVGAVELERPDPAGGRQLQLELGIRAHGDLIRAGVAGRAVGFAVGPAARVHQEQAAADRPHVQPRAEPSHAGLHAPQSPHRGGWAQHPGERDPPGPIPLSGA